LPSIEADCALDYLMFMFDRAQRVHGTCIATPLVTRFPKANAGLRDPQHTGAMACDTPPPPHAYCATARAEGLQSAFLGHSG